MLMSECAKGFKSGFLLHFYISRTIELFDWQATFSIAAEPGPALQALSMRGLQRHIGRIRIPA
jgi:hypothetical protein